jgi:hypothetical protein
MMFTALWLTDARPDLFPVMIWLAFGLLGAKLRSAAPSAGDAPGAGLNRLSRARWQAPGEPVETASYKIPKLPA